MKGLLLRLSAVDSDAEAAVRVIAYFDELVAHHATTSDLVRATASLAECVAGLQRGAAPPLRFRPDGTRATGTAPRAVPTQPGGPAHDGGGQAEPRGEATDLGGGRDGKTPGEGRTPESGPRGEALAAHRAGATDAGEGSNLAGEAPTGSRAAATALGDAHDRETPAHASDLGGETPAAPRAGAADHGGTHDGKIPAEASTPESGLGDEAPAAPRVLATDLGGETAGRVWLEREGEPGPLDDLVLERFAIAARVLGPAPQVVPHLADPALVELVLGERAAAEDRSRALVLLGLDAGRPLRVVAVGAEDGRDPGAAAVALVARGGTGLGARVAVVGEVAAVLVQPREGPATVVGLLENALSLRARERGSSGSVRVGVGDAVAGLEARRSWLQARLAERFAVPATEPLVVHENLGSLTLLAEIPAGHLRAQPDVRALDALAASDLETLEAFCRTGSLRQAAVALHRHHSSVATRLAHAEDALGWPLDDPAGRFRARLALLARRLAHRA
ncbi:helix-turn-helix domain-containing protein [Amycolatopsis sp. NPDC049253]|uniref:helix-turn-helix domain-containing protein n=1 Tax=Amycolatopsis sp. NPDC049253 TaxID=3155274 RepID=UPI0034394C47